ncbi:MAG: competence protein ComEC [Clostridiales bacterium]|nr:competence protein ComEC [Clostridiales bacterium]MDN5283310.1 competence protein ComEC [Candidatus Ozemobacter sp.]
MAKYGFEQKSFQSRKTNFVFFFLLIAVLYVWAVLLSDDLGGLVQTNLHPELRIDFVDVGQGDAMVVRTPAGKTYLIDGGTNVTMADARRENRELIQNYLRNLGITRLDGVVITHWHNDHLGGIIPVLRLYDVPQIWECPTNFETDTFKKYEDICAKKRIRRISARAGDVLEWGNELFVQVLHPDKKTRTHEYSDMNNMSIVLMIRYGKVQTLLAGDIEEEGEREVLKYGEGIKSQILKIPHHGSDTSDYSRFLKTVSPEIGVLMVGRNNSFRHPSDKALLAYGALGTKIFRTDRHGNIRLSVGGKDEKDYRFVVDRRL